MKNILCLTFFITLSCGEHKLSFDVENQKFISCNRKGIRNLSIENDSITPDGFAYGENIIITWNSSKKNKIPKELYLDSIAKGYYLFGYKNYKVIDKIILEPNSKFTVILSGGGIPDDKITIWTDSLGRVSKFKPLEQ